MSETLTSNGIALAPVTIGGVTLPAGSTAQQRFEAAVKGNAQPVQFHTDSTAMKFAQEDGTAIGGKAPPPTPIELEARNKWFKDAPVSPEAKIAQFDAEMRAAGKQITPSTSTPTPGEIDQEGIDLLTARYKVLATAAVGSPAILERHKKAYENDLAAFYNGKVLTDEQRTKMRLTGDAGTFVPKPKDAPAPAAPAAKAGWQSHIEDGQWVGLEHLTTVDTSGYTIPRFIKDQRLHTSTFGLLKQAKDAGISQAQVNAVLTQQARNNGWVKA